MEHKCKRDTFLRNKISGNICKLNWDTSFIDENIWEAWKPREGEWCYFLENSDSKYPVLAKFRCMVNFTEFSAEFGEEAYEFCQPITKNLPFNLGKQK